VVDIKVTKVIHAQIGQVYSILVDFNNYGKWWPIPVKIIDKEKGHFEIRPIPFVGIGLQIDHYSLNKEIIIKYIYGPFRGKGRWELKPILKEKVEISYSIRLIPVNRLINFIASTKFFEKKHTDDIKDIILGIERQNISNSKP
jgi:ribosome-associated toxin RatA of RatAB toxin-antitoxin module